MQAGTSLRNHFLIALPAMADPNFSRAVTLLCHHNDDGAMGIVLNRLSSYRLGEVLRQMDMQADDPAIASAPVLLGGPVQPERGFVLHEPTSEVWDSTFSVSPELQLTTSRDVLAAMARSAGPARALVALGYAGWSAGQLESELQANAWLTVAADNRILFETPLEERWNAAAGLMGVDLRRVTSYSGRA
jgi:putative transcriptional regulator